MSWFGGGSKETKQTPALSSSDYSSSGGFGGSSDSDFGSSSAGISDSSSESFEQQLMVLQQTALLQGAIFNITDKCFSTCVTSPTSSLSSSESSCIASTVKKYLETREFISSRITGGKE